MFLAFVFVSVALIAQGACSARDGWKCLQCQHLEILFEGLCLARCPDGYQNLQQTCLFQSQETIKTRFEPEETSEIEKVFQGTLEGLWMDTKRGAYFQQNSKLVTKKHVLLANQGTLSFWIFVETPGFVLFSQKNFEVALDGQLVKMMTYGAKSEALISQRTWQKVSLAWVLRDCGLVGRLSVGQVTVSGCEKPDSAWGISEEQLVFGGPLGFEGFLYSFFLSNQVASGPDYLGLVDCQIEQFARGGICEKCREKYPCKESFLDSNEVSRHSHARARRLNHCNNCLSCPSTTDPNPCQECISSFKLVFGLCITSNPTFITADTTTYTQTAELIFDLDLSNKILNDVSDSASSITVSSGSASDFYPNYDSNDPLAAKERGYYFTGSSYMTLSSSLLFAPEFSFAVWVSSELATPQGCIFSKTSTVSLCFNSAIIELKLFGSSVFSSSTTISQNTWYKIVVAMDATTNGEYVATFYINSETGESSSNLDIGIIDDSGTASNYIGSLDTSTDGFTGFIKMVRIYNIYKQQTDISSVFSSTTLPSAFCPISEYYDGSSCITCNSCSNGCCRGDTCNLCISESCINCSGYSSGECTSCISNAAGTNCDCLSTFFWDSTNKICASCQNNCDVCNSASLGDCTTCVSGYNLIQKVCIQACPSGYSGSCTFVKDFVFKLDLDNKILDSWTESESSILISTGEDNSFYPNYKSTDPYPTKERGYYFTGTSYLKGSSDSLKFAPESTIYTWIRPETTDAILFSKQDSSNGFLYKLEITSGFVKCTLGSLDFTSNYQVSSNSWNFIGVKMEINSDFKYEANFQINSNSEKILASATGYFDDSSTSFNILIGGSYPPLSNTFTGFIWKLLIYNSKSPDLSTLSSTSSPANCPITQFYDSTTCIDCNNACTTGCVRNDIKCNLCSDQQCSTCSDFSTCDSCITNASGNPCDCSPGFFWKSSTEECASCTSNCDTCSDEQFNSCTYCSTGFYLAENCCVANCPAGYSANSGTRTCDLVNSPGFDFKPEKIEDQVVGAGFIVTSGGDNSFYPSYASTDPYATRYRGYYFTGTSYMQGPPNSASSVYVNVAPQFTITCWVRPVNAGVIFSFQDSSDIESLTLEIDSSSKKFQSKVLLSTSQTFQGSQADMKGWNFVSLKGLITSTPSFQLTLTVNTTQSLSPELGQEFFNNPDQYMTIGSRRSSSSFSSYFTGFIYEIKIYAGNLDLTTVFSSSCTGCSSCPTSGCLPNCPITHFYDSTLSKCSLCKASCFTKGCVRFDTTCNLCSDQLCSVCYDYATTEVCTTCKTGASLISNKCTCGDGYAFSSVTEDCQPCPSQCSTCTKSNAVRCTGCNSNYYLLQGTCQSTCPSGYTISGSECTLDVDGFVFSLVMEKIEDFVVDSQSNLKVTTGTDSSFYPDYGTNDPMATNRGYYFNGSSFMSLPPNYKDSSSLLIFSPVFTFSSWIRYSSPGIIFIKQMDSSSYTHSVKVYVAGTHATVSLYLDYDGVKSPSELSCSTEIVKDTWQQLAFKITLNDASEITCMIHSTTTTSQQIGFYLLSDFTSSYTITIGAQKTSSYSSFLTGFIYSLKIWTLEVNPISLDYSSGNPPSVSLPNCGIGQFFDESCQNCLSSCASVGCVRADKKCNLCISQKCSSCSDFTSSCLSCITNAEGSPCDCSSGYYFDLVLEECKECPSACSTCTSSSLSGCSGCSGTTYALFDLCRNFCPSGYSISSNDCVVSNTLILSLKFDSISGQVTDLSPLGLKATTGSSSKFYPNYESNDPKASRYRGYYFDGTSSVVNLPPFGSISSPIIYFAPVFTFEAWVFPTVSSGTILSKQDITNYVKILNVGLSSSYLKMTAYFDSLGLKAFTCSETVVLSAWNFIAVKVFYSSSQSSASCTVGTTTGSTSSIGSGFLDDSVSAYKFTVGAASSASGNSEMFMGFIYQIKMQNSDESLSEFSNSCSLGCSLCPSSGTCLVSCLFSEYWTGGNHDSCSSCSAGCGSLGCLSSSVTCNLCDDIRCKVCTDYSSGTCTECITNAETVSACVCKSGYYWNSASETCDLCHSTCETCSAFGFLLCDTCKADYYWLNGACHPFCPSGFTASSGSCSESSSPSFIAVFEKISGVIYDSVLNIPIVTGTSSVFYPSMQSNDPYPLKDRGYYFTGSSLMRLPPSAEFASPVFLLGNSFTVAFWVSWLSDGTLLAIQSSTYASSLTITLSSQPVMSIRLLDADSVFNYNCETNLASNWNYLVFYLELNSDGYTYARCGVNTALGTLSSLSDGYHVAYKSFFTLGAKVQSSSVFSSFFSGYLYSLKIFNKYYLVDDTTNSCDTSNSYCTLCPSSTGVCINKCAFNKYWDGSACASCSGTCKSCVRSDSVCNLCYDEKCDTCTDFTEGTCTKCKPNASLSSGACTCNPYYFWDDINKKCSKCHSKCATCTGTAFLDCLTCNTGFYWFYDICLASCPKGFTSNSATLNCDMNHFQVLSLSFDTLNGQPMDSSPSTITARAGSSSTNFYPSYDSDDPFGTYKRGFYFRGSSKVFLPPYTSTPLPLLTLAPDINIAIWARPSSDGCLIAHQVNAVGVAQVFMLSITSSKPTLLLRMSTSGTVSVSSSSVTLDSWVHIGFIVQVTRAVGTSVSPYIDLVQGTVKSYAYDFFNAQSNNLLWIIGTRYQTTSSYSNFFTGFIFSIEIWNNEMTTNEWGLGSTCTNNPSSCLVCPSSSGVCLPECGINEFYDADSKSCGACKTTCLSGCRDAKYCNLCYDPICNNCNNVNEGSCINCKPNTKSGVTPCTCNTLYIWYEVDETCSKCYSGCTLCTSPIHNTCTSCSTDYFLTYSECLNFCPTLFSKDVDNKLCSPPSDLYVFKLDMADVIYGELLDSKSGFKVMTGTSSNFYPNYDSSDPIAADSRGYYFTGTSFLDVQNSDSHGLLSFPSKLTVGIWLNHNSDGTLFCKQHNPNISKYFELLIASDKLKINLIMTTGPFTATSSATLQKNIWHYITSIIDIDSSANTIVTFSINGVSESSIILAQDYFKDLSTSFYFLIGANLLSASTRQNFFTGYLWRVSFWQGVISDFSSEFSTTCSGCSECPVSTCLSSCTSIQLSSDCSSCPSCTTITCAVTSTCNLCNDLKCSACKDYTSTGCTSCKSNAEFTSGAGSPCKCSSGYSWNSATETCEICANLCSPCVDLLTTGCSACVSGAFFHSSVCMPFCPTGFAPNGPSCSGTNGLVLRLSFLEIKGVVKDTVADKIQVITGTSSTFYPNYENDDPFAANARGYYFDGINDYLKFVSNANNNLQMVFSPTHSVGFWILAYSDTGVLISKQDSASTPSDYLKFELISGQLKLTFKFKLITTLLTHQSTDSLSINIWNHVGYSLSINNKDCEVITSINGVSSSPTVLTAGHYEDLESSYLFIIGATQTTSSARSGFFSGIINEVKIWTLATIFSSELGNCPSCNCPSNNVCISTCPYTQYIVNGVCQSCDASCSSGCVRSSDCNLCYNKLCSTCQDFSATGCVTCKTNAELIVPSNACQCKLGSYEESLTSQCLLCFSYCETCTSGKNGDCLSCKSGKFMNPETGLCLTTCPVGYQGVGNVCAVDSSVTSPVVFQFTKLTNVMLDTKGVYGAYMGSSNAFFGAFDVNDPLPIYGRGVYFKGSSFVALPPNIANKTSLIMGNSHTLTMWARPQSHTTDHYLCSKEDGTNTRLSLYFDKNTMQTKATYLVFDDGSGNSASINALGPTLASWDSWVEAAVTLQRTGYSMEVTVYLNGVTGAISSLPNTFYHDTDSNSFIIGQNKILSRFLKGFVFDIKIFNSIVPVSAPSTSCGCAGCPTASTCLLSCGYLEYYESSCKPCKAECTTGCINGKNCNMNLDKLCKTSTGFTVSECTSCTDLSTGAGNGCQCMANSVVNLDSGLCNCVDTYTMFQNECVPCFYPLQKTDIHGYFSEDYLKLLFNMDYAVKSTTSSDCKDLFESLSYSMLGVSPKCSWNTNRTLLSVTLGTNATVARSPLTFKAKSLYTNTNFCGIDPTAVTINIDFKYPTPEIIPIPWLFAPLSTFIQCDDLYLDGSKSSNGFNRPLKFSWIFVSTPKLPILSGYEEDSSAHSSIFLSKSSLSSSTVKVTMKVTNWLENSNSITQSIQIISGTGLHLILDGDTKWVMRSSDSKTIFIQATSSCAFSNSLSYSWKVSSYSGNYSGFDNVALMKDQTVPSRIYIPPKVFRPGFYTFQVNVTDNAKGMSGSTQFTITVQSQDLVIILPAEHFTVDARVKFSVSGEKCSDPDLLSEELKFNWSCLVDSSNCSSLILDKTSKVMTINSGLVSGKSYLMRLTISKDERTAFKDFTVKAVNFTTPVVTFSVNNEVVNSQLPVRILAEVTGAGISTFLWALESGGAVSYSTPLDGIEIGLKANSLTQGMKYVFRFEVTVAGQISAFITSFTVMKQPSGGSLEVSPNKGNEYSTVFKISAPGWVDSDLIETGILTYQFGYNLNNQVYILNIRNQSSFLYTRLPYSPDPLVIWVKVLNRQGGYSLATTTVSVIKSKEDLGSEALSSLSNLLNNELSDPAELPEVIGYTALYYLSNSSVKSSEKKQAFEQVLSGIDRMIDTTVNCQYQDIQNILDVISSVTSQYKPESYTQVSSRLASVLSLSQSSGVVIDSAQLQSYVNIIVQGAGLSNDLFKLADSPLVAANDDIQKVLITASDHLAVGESLSYNSQKVQVHATCYSSSISNYSSPGIPGRKGSVSLKGQVFSVSNPLLFVFILYDDQGGNSTDTPTGLDFSIIELAPTGKKKLTLDLNPPVSLEIPILNYTKGKVQCVYHKNNWSDYGCSLVKFENSVAFCSCNHSSLFAAGSDLLPYVPPPVEEEPQEEADKSTWLLLFYYLCGLLGTWIIISSVLLIIDQNEFAKRKTAEDVANQRYNILYKPEGPVENVSKSEKKMNETITVDQNPTFFKRINYDEEIIATSRKEANPFLNQGKWNKDTERSFVKVEEFKEKLQVQEVDSRDSYLKESRNPFRVHYFFSFFVFYDPFYSRFVRSLVLFTSLSFQCFFLGVFVTLLKEQLEVPKKMKISEVLENFHWITGLLCLAVVVFCNFFVWPLKFSMKNIINVQEAGQTMVKKRSRFWKVFGIAFSMGSMGFCIFSTYFLANLVYTPQSVLWFCMTIVCLLIDLFVAQVVKILFVCCCKRNNAQATVTPETHQTP